MTDGPNNGFVFTIDTDSYAGNFEREMTAFLTGQVGECGVGEDMVEPLSVSFDNIMQVPDEHGCCRPTSCWPEPKSKKYNAVAIFFETKPTQEQIDFMKERVKLFDGVQKTKSRMSEFNVGKPAVEILGFRLIEIKTTSTETEIAI